MRSRLEFQDLLKIYFMQGVTQPSSGHIMHGNTWDCWELAFIGLGIAIVRLPSHLEDLKGEAPLKISLQQEQGDLHVGIQAKLL